jgi:hypothetical protein
MGVGFSGSAILEPELYQNIPDAVEREGVFESYKTWRVSDVEHVINDLASTHDNEVKEKIGALDDEIEAVEEELHAHLPEGDCPVCMLHPTRVVDSSWQSRRRGKYFRPRRFAAEGGTGRARARARRASAAVSRKQ